ncbi:hypothetical protein A1Q2_00980 [Trichosporon asahii var. asahii CBS 8904]|uniref:Uncharacterized protein n=1 Tax=Trichosporon asahii var. asahii (strain CBS 8904) TaxID=1220162 RepID=K1VKR5_TRIAC|nr:hypothetical protein A1Q2_00980 [Trichosporon asahii var. asahii CBS 8904]
MVSTRSRTYPPTDAVAATTSGAAPRRSSRRPRSPSKQDAAPVPEQPSKRPRTQSPAREDAGPSSPPARHRAPRRRQVFPFDESDSPPPSPSAPSGSSLPLSHQVETNQKIKRLEAKIKVLEREARYHEEMSKRWEKLSSHLLHEREGEDGYVHKLKRRGDTYKKAYLEEKEESRRMVEATKYGIICVKKALEKNPDHILRGTLKVLEMSLPYDEAE